MSAKIWRIYAQKMLHYKQSNSQFSFSRIKLSEIHGFRYESANSQKNRDKQRLVELEKTLNEEKQNKQRLETQIKTERALTKKLQDDLTKLSLAPPRFVTPMLSLVLYCPMFSEVNVQNSV